MIPPKPHIHSLLERFETAQKKALDTPDQTSRCLDIAIASFDLILSRISGVSERDQSLALLKLAERLLESAAYSSAGTLSRNDVTEFMLLSAQVAGIATKLSAQGAPMGAGVNRYVG